MSPSPAAPQLSQLTLEQVRRTSPTLGPVAARGCVPQPASLSTEPGHQRAAPAPAGIPPPPLPGQAPCFGVLCPAGCTTPILPLAVGQLEVTLPQAPSLQLSSTGCLQRQRALGPLLSRSPGSRRCPHRVSARVLVRARGGLKMSKRGPDFKGPANMRLKAAAQRGQREGARAEPAAAAHCHGHTEKHHGESE